MSGRRAGWWALALAPMLVSAGARAQAAAYSVQPATTRPDATRPNARRPDAARPDTPQPDNGASRYYATADHRPLWIRDGRAGPEVGQLLAILDRAAAQGLSADTGSTADLAAASARARPGADADNARAERMLSDAWVGYVRALPPSNDAGMEYIDAVLAPRRRFAVEILNEAAAAPSLAEHLAATAMVNPIYDGLARRLADWRARWDGVPPVAISDGPSLTSGDEGERVRLLRMRLGVPPGERFDARTADALRAFKAGEGLAKDAVADAGTVARLNATAAETDRRLRLNLDRARALPIGGAGKYVVVDAGGARLWMIEGDKVVGSMKVVVGKATEPTPMAAGLIRSVVLNPYWNLPPDLVTDRFAARVRDGGAGYLKGGGYQLLSDWDDGDEAVDPRSVDWAAVTAGRATVRMRQLPGPTNAMGAVKFMFPNRFGVYLHDTPTRALFDKPARNFSSGCVRLEDAKRLESWLFDASPPIPSGQAEENVALPRPVPVYLTYLTADWQGDDPRFRADVYGRDEPDGASS